jgi:hypothetical protein
MEFIRFIFQDLLHFAGFFLLTALGFDGVTQVVRALRERPKQLPPKTE